VTELAAFLRYSLLSSGAAEVTVSDEVESLRRYLALERVRYEERLQVDVRVEPGVESRRLPSFLLHPLAENAVKYGIRTSTPPLRVAVAARAEGSRLVVEVANTGRWCEPVADPVQNGLGIGLENVRQRLARLYPGRHRFEVGQDDGWVRARVESAEEQPG
jgi:two-component system LytT family sensor kinase